MTKNWIGSLVVGAMMSVGSIAVAQDAVSIGYVDLQLALNNVDDGVAAREQLESDFEDRQEEINSAQEELETWAADLESGLPMMDEAARMGAMQEYQTRLMALQETFQAHQMELAQAEMEATQEIFENMVIIVEEIAVERGYTMVLERTESSVLYASPGLDFTDELVTRYDDRH